MALFEFSATPTRARPIPRRPTSRRFAIVTERHPIVAFRPAILENCQQVAEVRLGSQLLNELHIDVDPGFLVDDWRVLTEEVRIKGNRAEGIGDDPCDVSGCPTIVRIFHLYPSRLGLVVVRLASRVRLAGCPLTGLGWVT
jgi:hypothetical protein